MPLCGAALTFFAAAKKDKQRKRLKPLMLSGHRSLLGVVVRLESVFVPLHVLVTRASYFRRRCARRRVLHKTSLCVSSPTPRRRGVARHCTAVTISIPIATPTADANVTVAGIGPGWSEAGRRFSTRAFHLKREFPGECRGASPRRSRRPPQTSTEAHGFPCIPVRDARSAEWELTSPLSLTPNVREHGFQSHHYPQQTTVPT